MTLQLLIVDDEPLARLRLRALVQDLQATLPPGAGWVVAGEAAGADQALQQLSQQPVHALLLDIHMPGQSGLQLARALRAMPDPPAVVFVTAHAEHALQAFELEAVDYLTKPVRRERLAQALQRVQDRLLRAAPAPDSAATAAVLVIHERGRVLRLPVAELLYFRADQKQVLLRTTFASYVVDDSLADLEERLRQLQPAGRGFIRVHRNALVALSALRELQLRQTVGVDAADAADAAEISEGWAVRVAPLDEWLAVSRRQVSAVKAALGAAGM